jgi:hypothetical protein
MKESTESQKRWGERCICVNKESDQRRREVDLHWKELAVFVITNTRKTLQWRWISVAWRSSSLRKICITIGGGETWCNVAAAVPTRPVDIHSWSYRRSPNPCRSSHLQFSPAKTILKIFPNLHETRGAQCHDRHQDDGKANRYTFFP